MNTFKIALYLLFIVLVIIVASYFVLRCKPKWVLAFDATTFTEESCRSMCEDMYKAKKYKIERNAVEGAGGVYFDRCYCDISKCLFEIE